MKYLMWLLSAVIAYLLGNISTGLIVVRLMAHTDIRKVGSGNAGTTNVMRTLGWVPSVITLLGDVLKAIAAVLIGRWLGGEVGALIAGVAVIAGHNWPVFFGFRGGKGMASSLGVILMIDPWIALILFAVQVIVLVLTRYMSLASIVTSVIYPILVALFHPGDWLRILFALAMSFMALFSHRANIHRLLQHRENRLDFSRINKLSRRKKNGEEGK